MQQKKYIYIFIRLTLNLKTCDFLSVSCGQHGSMALLVILLQQLHNYSDLRHDICTGCFQRFMCLILGICYYTWITAGEANPWCTMALKDLHTPVKMAGFSEKWNEHKKCQMFLRVQGLCCPSGTSVFWLTGGQRADFCIGVCQRVAKYSRWVPAPEKTCGGFTAQLQLSCSLTYRGKEPEPKVCLLYINYFFRTCCFFLYIKKVTKITLLTELIPPPFSLPCFHILYICRSVVRLSQAMCWMSQSIHFHTPPDIVSETIYVWALCVITCPCIRSCMAIGSTGPQPSVDSCGYTPSRSDVCTQAAFGGDWGSR